MKLALSSLLAPTLSLPELLGLAKLVGADGVDLTTPVSKDEALAAVTAEPAIKVLAVSAQARYHGRHNQDVVSAGVIECAIDLAATVGCPVVRIDDAEPRGGQTPQVMTEAYATFLLPLADFAVERGVTLLVENGPTFRRARDLWTLLDRLQHPGLGVSWNVLASVVARESPLVTIPTLNARIRHVRLADARLVDGKLIPVQLGEGIVPAAQLLRRLRGIGYAAGVSLVAAPATDATGFLAESVKRVREWTKPFEPPKPKVPAKPTAAAARAAPAAASGPIPRNG